MNSVTMEELRSWANRHPIITWLLCLIASTVIIVLATVRSTDVNASTRIVDEMRQEITALRLEWQQRCMNWLERGDSALESGDVQLAQAYYLRAMVRCY